MKNGKWIMKLTVFLLSQSIFALHRTRWINYVSRGVIPHLWIYITNATDAYLICYTYRIITTTIRYKEAQRNRWTSLYKFIFLVFAGHVIMESLRGLVSMIIGGVHWRRRSNVIVLCSTGSRRSTNRGMTELIHYGHRSRIGFVSHSLCGENGIGHISAVVKPLMGGENGGGSRVRSLGGSQLCLKNIQRRFKSARADSIRLCSSDQRLNLSDYTIGAAHIDVLSFERILIILICLGQDCV